MTRIGSKTDVTRATKQLRNGGFSVSSSPECVFCSEDGVDVYRALLKSKNIWIVWYNEAYFSHSETF